MCLRAGRSQKTLKSRCLRRCALCSPAGARQLARKELPVCLGSLLTHPDQRLGPHPAGGPHPSNRTAPARPPGTPLRPAGSLFSQPHAQPCLHSGRPCRNDTSWAINPQGARQAVPFRCWPSHSLLERSALTLSVNCSTISGLAHTDSLGGWNCSLKMNERRID